MKFFIGSAGATQTFLKGIPEENINNIKSFGDGKLLVLYKGEYAPLGEPIIQEKIIEKEVEVIKEVMVDNPEQAAIIDALTKENAALNKELEKLKAEIPKLKEKIKKLAEA